VESYQIVVWRDKVNVMSRIANHVKMMHNIVEELMMDIIFVCNISLQVLIHLCRIKLHVDSVSIALIYF
jgi:hypothetical protein